VLDNRTLGFLEILGIPPPDNEMPSRQLYLVPTEKWDAFRQSDLGSSDGKDTIGFLHRTCQTSLGGDCIQSKQYVLRDAAAKSEVNRLSQATMRSVLAGDYELILWFTGKTVSDVKGTPIKLKPGANVIQFSAIR
jgi:hypothetical protein